MATENVKIISPNALPITMRKMTQRIMLLMVIIKRMSALCSVRDNDFKSHLRGSDASRFSTFLQKSIERRSRVCFSECYSFRRVIFE